MTVALSRPRRWRESNPQEEGQQAKEIRGLQARPGARWGRGTRCWLLVSEQGLATVAVERVVRRWLGGRVGLAAVSHRLVAPQPPVR